MSGTPSRLSLAASVLMLVASLALPICGFSQTSATGYAPPVTIGSNPNTIAIAVDSNNGNIYVAFDVTATTFPRRFNNVLLARSTDGGLTFTTTFVAGQTIFPAPAVAVGPFGEVYVAYVLGENCLTACPNNTPEAATVELVESVDGGRTFSSPVQISTVGSTAVDLSQPALTVDPTTGRIYIAWAESGTDPTSASALQPYMVQVRTSVHGVTTFSAATTVATGPQVQIFLNGKQVTINSGLEFVQLALNGKGNGYISWLDCSTQDCERLYYAGVSNGAVSGNGALAASNLYGGGSNGNYQIGVDPKGRLLITYAANSVVGNTTDIFYVREPGGQPQHVSFPESSGLQAYNPSLTVDHFGAAWVAWSGHLPNATSNTAPNYIFATKIAANQFLLQQSPMVSSPNAIFDYNPALALDLDGDPVVAFGVDTIIGPNFQSALVYRRLSECIDVDGDGNADDDGDGLCDNWEVEGIKDADGNVLLNLPAMGADPKHKDIFVQMDRLVGSPFSTPDALNYFIRQFAAAPVSNPDGHPGITLHVDNGPDSLMSPARGDWGNLSAQSIISDHTDLGVFADCGGVKNGCFSWDTFDAIKRHYFPPERAAAFHYAIYEPHQMLGSDGATEVAAGISRGGYPAGASDFIVAQAPANPYQVGSIFMHELGHNLGLSHGGDVLVVQDGSDTEINLKPNYLSIMNYQFLYPGLPLTDGNFVYDYSRFGPDSDPSFRLPVLDEAHLNENTGLGTPTIPVGDAVLIFRSSRLCIPGGDPVVIDSLSGPVDWDCFRPSTDSDVSKDVNGDGKLTLLEPYDDWANLVYRGGQIGSLSVKAALPPSTTNTEPTPAQLEQYANFWAQQQVQQDKIPPVTAATLSPLPNAAGWNNSNVIFTLTATDNETGGTGVKQITYSASGAQAISNTVANGASASFTVSVEGITTVTFFGTDNAGNVESAKTVTIRLDKTPPTITPQVSPLPNANGWNNTNVTVSFQCSDNLSGLAAGSPPAATVLSSEGAGQSVNGTCTDVAGNSASAAVSGINIDKTPPTVSCTANPSVLWPPNNKLVPVNISVNVSDSLSGPAGFTLLSVTSNEPDSGDGDIQGFAIATASTSGQLRAQRLGSGTGRLYTFMYNGADRAGNSASCTTTFSVPHDQGQ